MTPLTSCLVVTSVNSFESYIYGNLKHLEMGEGCSPYKGLMGTCGQPGYVFWDFCLEQGIKFTIFCLNQGIDLSILVLNWVKCPKQDIKNRNSVLKWVGKSVIVNRVRV